MSLIIIDTVAPALGLAIDPKYGTDRLMKPEAQTVRQIDTYAYLIKEK